MGLTGLAISLATCISFAAYRKVWGASWWLSPNLGIIDDGTAIGQHEAHFSISRL